MIGKGKESKYILTRLFATDYFYHYTTPVIFAAYFYPFIAYGKGEVRTYYDSEMSEKIKNIKEHKHGTYYNFATQGLGNVALYEPCISFEYFYNRLSIYDNEKEKYFNNEADYINNVESETVKQDIKYVLSKKELFLKRGTIIPESIKLKLIEDLKSNNNKYVLAELLYYVISPNHTLPNIVAEKGAFINSVFNSRILSTPNVYLGFRYNRDENEEELYKKLSNAIGLQMLFFNGGTFYGKNDMFRQEGNLNNLMQNVMLHTEKKYIEIVVSQWGSEADIEASKYKINPIHNHISKEKFSKISLKNIVSLKNKCQSGIVSVKTTSMFLPYALFIVSFEDKRLDYIKVDMYSPFLNNDLERPSMYIFREITPELFFHFKNVFINIWKDDECSHFV